jgi:hypothetical protein
MLVHSRNQLYPLVVTNTGSQWSGYITVDLLRLACDMRASGKYYVEVLSSGAGCDAVSQEILLSFKSNLELCKGALD